MDGTIVNVRVFSWHFQIAKGTFRPSLSRNEWHKRTGWPDGYFSVYRVFGYRG